MMEVCLRSARRYNRVSRNNKEGKYGLGQSKKCADIRFSGIESAAVLSAVDGSARSGQRQPGLYFLSAETQAVMEQKGIRVLSPIPAATPQLPDITYIYSGEEQDAPPVLLTEPVDSGLMYSSFSELSSALQGQIPDIANYRFDSQESEVGKFVLHPLVDQKYSLFRVRLELINSNQKSLLTAIRRLKL